MFENNKVPNVPVEDVEEVSNYVAAMINGKKLGNFDVVYEPASTEQIFAGQLVARENRLYFDTWTNFTDKSARRNPVPPHRDLADGPR